MSPTRIRCAATIAALAVALTACGAGERAADNTTTTAAATDVDAEFTAMQEQIAACMKAKGWDYRPAAPVEAGDRTESVKIDRSYGKEHGYGIADGLAAGGGAMFDADGATGAAGISVGTPVGSGAPKDPNAEYVESLSDTDRDQYFRDLLGDTFTTGPDGSGGIAVSGSMSLDAGDGVSPATSGGCSGEAAKQHSPSLSELPSLTAPNGNDPKLAAAADAWAACMAKAGYDIATPTDAISAFVAREVTPLQQAAGGSGRLDDATIAKVRRLEIEQWSADDACQTSSHYAKVLERANADALAEAEGKGGSR